MSTELHSLKKEQLKVDIIYDGITVSQGLVRYLDAASSFIVIRDFPLGAGTFLEIAIHFTSGKIVRVPAQLIDNTGEGLEVVLECAEPTMLQEFD